MPVDTLYIKNMVCNRCIKVVEEILKNLDHEISSIELGKVVLQRPIDQHKLDEVRNLLDADGFELIDDNKSRIINQIKTIIIESIYHEKHIPLYMNLSEFLTKEIGHDYSYLSKLFSSIEGITIEKYLILQKVERVKELLVYNEHSLSEIAYQLGYSSVQHLSNQFRKITGLSPSYFKKIKNNRRKPIDKV